MKGVTLMVLVVLCAGLMTGCASGGDGGGDYKAPSPGEYQDSADVVKPNGERRSRDTSGMGEGEGK